MNVTSRSLTEVKLTPLWRGEVAAGTSTPLFTLPERPQPGRKFRKLIFFLWREGVAMTLRKTRATVRVGRAAAQLRLELVLGTREHAAGIWLGVGPQCAGDPGALRFAADLVAPLPLIDHRGLADSGARLAAAARAALQAQPELTARALRWSPFAQRPPEAALRALVVELAGLPLPGDESQPDDAAVAGTIQSKPAAAGAPGPGAAPGRRAGRGHYDLVLIGGGAYPQCYVLPELKQARPALLIEQQVALQQATAREFGFRASTARLADAEPLLADLVRPVAVVAGYHSTHVADALRLRQVCPGLPLLIEKPPLATAAELEPLLGLVASGGVTIGYNRRFAPLAQRVRALLGAQTGPVTLTMDIKEVPLLDEHWYFWPNQGSRLVGNLCHWLDLAVYLVGQPVADTAVLRAPDDARLDRVVVSLRFIDGSLATLCASDQGDGLRGVQEQILIRRGNLSLHLDDFCTLRGSRDGRALMWRRRFRDKGHRAMYRNFERSLLSGGPTGSSLADVEPSTRLLLDVMAAADLSRCADVA